VEAAEANKNNNALRMRNREVKPMKRFLIPTITIALAGVLIGQVVPGDDTVRPRQQQAMETLKTALGLDDSQIQQLVDVRRSTAEANRTTAEQVRTQREALRALREAGNPDPTRVGTILNEIDQLQAQIRANQEQGRQQAVALMNGWGQGDRLEQLQAAVELVPAIAPARRLGLIGPVLGPANQLRNGAGRANQLRNGAGPANAPRPRLGPRGAGLGPGLGGPPPQD